MNDEEIKAWMAECTRLVIDHLRRQGFPIDDYRVELVLTECARDPSEPLTATELIARNATSFLERVFSESPSTPIVEAALRELSKKSP